MIEPRIGNIYQIDPEKDKVLGGQFMVATEVKATIIQGYLLLDQADNGTLVRHNGRAFIRRKYEDLVCVGFVEWFPNREEEKEV